jgi:hypothetical protein
MKRGNLIYSANDHETLYQRAYISAPKHVMRENAVLKPDEYETLALHVLVIT